MQTDLKSGLLAVSEAVRDSFQGTSVAKIRDGREEVDVILGLPDSDKTSLESLKNLKVKVMPDKFAKLKAAAYVPRRPTSIIGKNQQLFDLGMNHIEMEQKNEVIEKIAELDTQLDFVLIAEYFDESLVLLAKLLCWDLADVRWIHPIITMFM